MATAIMVIVGTGILLGVVAYYFKNYDLAPGKHKSLHVGFGYVQDYLPESNQVIIVSRLLDSPAGRAGFQWGDVLISRGGVDLTDIKSPEDYWARVARFQTLPMQNGSLVTFVLERNGVRRTVVLQAEWVKKDFYVPPTKAQQLELNPRLATGLVTSGMAIDSATGYPIPQLKLSDEAIDALIK